MKKVILTLFTIALTFLTAYSNSNRTFVFVDEQSYEAIAKYKDDDINNLNVSDPNVVYESDFDNEMTGGVPEGWTTWNEAGFHLYGFNDGGSQYNYNWGGNPGGGGTRLYEGFSGDFNKALYWGSRGTNEGYATYGEQVKDYMLQSGVIDPNMPEGIALKLDARKYQISFLMAAWKGEPTFTFTLEDLSGNVHARFSDLVATPNVNGATGRVTGSVSCVKDFTTSVPGYYVLRFTAAEAQWQEYLLVSVKIIAIYDCEINGIFYNIDETSKTASVISNMSKPYKGSITIPSTIIYNGTKYTVNSIGGGAFSSCINLTSITIPNSITSIGESAFAYCSGLLSIDIPNSVTSIGESAFSGCSGLLSIDIPNSITSIRESAFSGCSGLNNITIPSSVTSIGNSAFTGCSGLTSIEIPSNVTSIGNSAFSGCSNLTTVTINSNAILSKSYSSSSNINKLFGSQVTEYVIGEGVTRIGDYAFYRCSGLTSVTIPSSVTNIGYFAFNACNNLTTVTINSNALLSKSYSSSSIINELFGSQVTEFVLGEGVTSIGDYAFYRCSGLTSVTIPSSVTNIGYYAFNGCSGLKKVIVKDIAAWCNVYFSTVYSNPLYYAHHIFSDDNTEITKLIIPNSVTNIGNSVFTGCSGLTSIEIPSSVTSIGNSAFSGCSGLTSIDINTKTIDTWFSGLTSIKTITLGEEVTSIGESAFSGCSGLTSIEIPSNVTSIGNSAFSGCSGLTSIEIPSNVTSIGESAFSGCSGLTSIEIPSSATSIGNSAFSGCSGLTSVTIPSSVTSIESSAFNGCNGLKKVIVKDIAAWCKIAFANSSSNPLYYAHHLFSDENTEITKLIIPNSVTSIGNSAFTGCSGLTSIEIPSTVTSIGSSAFSGCSGLTSIEIPSSVTSIGSLAFQDCTSLSDITSEITDVFVTGTNAFAGCENATLHVPAGTYVAYSGRADWNRIIHIVEGTEGFKMTMACNTKGSVLVNDETIFTNKIKDVEVNEEEENTFEFIPNEGCKLEQVTLNGLDVIASVENNILKAVIPANSQMNVVFSKMGDINNDGNIDISDVVSLVNMILGQ